MKRGMSLLIPCFILLAGIAVMLYPKAAEFVNTRSMQEEIDAFESGLKARGQQADVLRQETALDSWTEAVIRMAERNESDPLPVLVAADARVDADEKEETDTLQQTNFAETETTVPSQADAPKSDGATLLQTDAPKSDGATLLQTDAPKSDGATLLYADSLEHETAVIPPTESAKPKAVEKYRVQTNDEYGTSQTGPEPIEAGYDKREALAYAAPEGDMASVQDLSEVTVNSAETNEIASAVIAASATQDLGEAVLQLTSAGENMVGEALKMSVVLRWIIDQYNASQISEEVMHERIETEVLRFCITESLSVAELDPTKYAEYIAEAEVVLGEMVDNEGADTEEMFIRLEKAALLNGSRYDMNMAYDAESTDGGLDSVWSSVINRMRMWRVCLFGTGKILEELYADIQQYNEMLFQTGQADLKDPFSYSQASFDLSAYGLSRNIIGYLTIPRMEIELPIYLGANKENMAKGGAHLTETSIPIGGNNTNAVIAAHRGMSTAAMFRNIEKLEIGDAVYITNYWKKLTYRVCEIAIIKPSDVESVLIQEDRDMVTLLTCHPYRHNYQRYVVFCERENPADFDSGEDKDNPSEGAELRLLGGQYDKGEHQNRSLESAFS